MNWIADRLRRQTDSQERNRQSRQEGNDSEAARLWDRFVQRVERDLDAYRREKRNADLQRVSDVQYRVSNTDANTAVIITVDFSDHIVRYAYEPLSKRTAVPEEGILTIRTSGRSLHLYSADQKLTVEQACRLILEPLLFPSLPDDLEATGT